MKQRHQGLVELVLLSDQICQVVCGLSDAATVNEETPQNSLAYHGVDIDIDRILLLVDGLELRIE